MLWALCALCAGEGKRSGMSIPTEVRGYYNGFGLGPSKRCAKRAGFYGAGVRVGS